MKKKFDGAFKAKVALEAVKGEKTIAQIASEYGVTSEPDRPVEETASGGSPRPFL